jgi:hypothetical protein
MCKRLKQTDSRAQAAYQTYTIVPAQAATPLPGNVTFEAASAVPLALSTAACGLYQKEMLNLPLPTNDPKSIGKALLVWGGSSAVGATTIQLAKASGLEVVATASPRNFEMVKDLGASDVLDYSSSSIVNDLVSWLKGKNVAGAYDGEAQKLFYWNLLTDCSAISEGGTGEKVAEVLSQVGGGFIACALYPPEKMLSGVSGSMGKYSIEFVGLSSSHCSLCAYNTLCR